MKLLTDEGKSMYEEHHGFHQECTSEISRDLTNEQVKTLSELLEVVLERL
ncbi:MAG: hypothetical protein GQ542_05915 [Desulforhopalus sp.]|nr:hypothetical protein [Desulforhopalus sp.]